MVWGVVAEWVLCSISLPRVRTCTHLEPSKGANFLPLMARGVGPSVGGVEGSARRYSKFRDSVDDEVRTGTAELLLLCIGLCFLHAHSLSRWLTTQSIYSPTQNSLFSNFFLQPLSSSCFTVTLPLFLSRHTVLGNHSLC